MIPITLTTAAARRIHAIQERNQAAGVSIALKKGGCAGMEYVFAPLPAIPEGVHTVSQNGANLIIDPLAEMFLFGTEIDYTEGLLESGFVFRNPNVTSACGCGASVSF